ncbi:restriction endonuclease subunit S [Xanthomonas translucens]|uniref:restriction endonuclease subunit S n=1 Tax=Xanthomonas campestris pv. translucens TaxID=343 RepID=UPI001E2C9CF0|nr:restriction endonuclease subunit S [Xanthomonas translucens]
MLPDGWRRTTLGNIGSIKSGSTPARSQHDRYFVNGKWPWVKTMDLTNSVILKTDELITDAALNESSCKIFPAGTVLVAMYGGLKQIGRTGLLQEESAVNQAISAIDVERNQAHPEFILHWLNGNVEAWKNFAASSRKDPNITRENVCDFPVILPTLGEQRRIVHILSTWDQAIATTERFLANGRMQWNALIGLTLHLPSANRDASAPAENSGFPASVQPGIPTLPPAPPGWRRIQLRDHLKEVRRPVALVNDETYTLVTVKRSRGGVELREVLQGNEVKTPTQFYVHADDFLISKRQIVHGACGIVPPALDGAVVSNEYAVLNTDGEIDLRFLRYLSESRYFQQTCFHSSIGVHVEKMIFKTDHWLNWPFNIPPLAQQEYIVGILDTASREIASISEQLKALKREKSALMAQLLTGKRRVHLPADEAASA